MESTRRVGVLRTGYVWVVLGCPGVRRGVWIRLLLSVKDLAIRCTQVGPNRLSSASINLQTHTFVRARLAKKIYNAIGKPKDPPSIACTYS